jgi:type IV fimbrial biogenesis protein FimT
MTKQRAAGPRRPAGFSVFELLVVVAIAAILAAVAVPAFARLIQDNRRAATVNELMRTVLLARTEAIKRGHPVVICGFDDRDHDRRLDPDEQSCHGRDWSDGWIAAAWIDADGDAVVDDAELQAAPLWHHINELAEIRVTANSLTSTPPVAPAGTAVFRPFALRSANGTITVCDRRGPAEARGVIISPNGRARVSSLKAVGDPLACP